MIGKTKILKSIFCIAMFTAMLSLPVIGQTDTGPISKPASGYGSDGGFAVATKSFANPEFSNCDIVVHYPSGISAPVPTIFYSHAYGGNNPDNVSGFMKFVVKKAMLQFLCRIKQPCETRQTI